MKESFPKQFTSPEEEISFLREQIAAKERELLERNKEVDQVDIETLGKQELKEYSSFTPRMILDPSYRLEPEEVAVAVEVVEQASNKADEIIKLAEEKGIRNALSVLEKMDNAFSVDEAHRRLIEMIKSGVQIDGVKEGMPVWNLLNMTLYEVVLPEQAEGGKEYVLSEQVGMMNQLLAGLQTIGGSEGLRIVLEVAVADLEEQIIFYMAVPSHFSGLFEKQVLSLFPRAELIIQSHDYNIFVDGGTTIMAEVELKKHPIYPLRTHEEFASDPLMVILNAFSKIDKEGGGAALQLVLHYPKKNHNQTFQTVISNLKKGMKEGEAIRRSTTGGEIMASISEFVFSKKAKEKEHLEIDNEKIELFSVKTKANIMEANLRLAVSAKEKVRAEQILTEISSTLNQFGVLGGNNFEVKEKKGVAYRLQKAFSFREFLPDKAILLSFSELATLMHFPLNGLASSPQFKQLTSGTAAAPSGMPTEGTLLGINSHRNVDKMIFVTDEDRVRHFYIIGQTGTGKTTLMKNMVVQDIRRGDGVCMIDPHGTDIEDVLSAVPKERADDVIYFDPSRLDRSLGLNMLEYDVTKSEQKTFVVNELFSIFKKLYSAESMGPMFEQYFRNATLLVLEHPASGCTLMDIAKVMVDAEYRKFKLSKATNPVVVQFWQEIAGKAGGEASLENIVPYIVSKFDVFTANDYMRPIIGQQKSSFNFRQLMDQRKILLVNLSKGRLGDINANLIGMILVGKILMAALSRVDDPTRGFPPFYLHMDEFQNISTDAISAILSEARKYKLGLTIAHQFTAQLDQGIKDAVFGNVGSMSAFRVGPEDAQFLEQQFAPVFTAKDLMNIPNRNAVMRILANGTPTKPFSMKTMPPPPTDMEWAKQLMDLSYQKHGRPREEVEMEIAYQYGKKPAPKK